MSFIGLDNVHYAKLKKDDATGVEYETPKRLYGAISINAEDESETAKLYADNQLWETQNSTPETNVEINFADIPLEDYAFLGGHSIGANGELIYSADDVAPDIALLGEGLKGDGSKRYFKLLKGKCSEGGFELNTKTDSPEFTTPTMTATFMPRKYDKRYKIIADSSNSASATLISNWYSSVE